MHSSRSHVQRRIRGVVLFAIVASAIAAAPLVHAGGGKQVPPRATARVQSKPGGEHRRVRALALSLGASRVRSSGRPEARPKGPPKAREQAALVVAAEGVKGVVIDGPRHTYRAIRKNPIKFAAGLVAMGAIGALGVLYGFPGDLVAVGLSSLAVGAQIKLAWPKLKQARGAELARRIGADVVWPTALFFGSWAIGHGIVGDHAAHAPPTLAELGTSFASSAVIGGDAPAVAVTALDTARGGDGASN